MGNVSKERYKELDEWGICHSCKKKFKAPGKQFCLDCLDKKKAITARYRENHPLTDEQKAVRAEHRKKLYNERKENGLCIRCGKPATHGKYCYKHYIQMRKDSLRRSQKATLARHERGLITDYRKENRLCYYCGKPIEEDNPTRACNACRQRQSEASKKAIENTPWKRSNHAMFM